MVSVHQGPIFQLLRELMIGLYIVNIVKLQTVIFVVVLRYKTLYINNIIVVITIVAVDRIVCF